MDLPFIKTAILFMGLALASNANATTYDFSETIQGISITGSFTGTASGNYISGISNISVTADGTAFTGLIDSYGYDNFSNSFIYGNASVTFNGVGNNFTFAQDALPNNSLTNYIPYGESHQWDTVTIGGTTYTDAYKISPSNWSVTAVPETGEWAMMLLGLPLLGWVVRRKQSEMQIA